MRAAEYVLRVTHRAFCPTLILGTGWLAFALYAYPGLTTKDSLDQLVEARSGVFSDAHPPVMQAIWRIVEYVVAGPFGMVVLQTATFVVGAFLILRHALAPRAAALAAVALLAFPPVGAVMAVVWKDCLMAGLLMLGIGLLLETCRWRKLAALPILVLAAAVRYNALAATLPPIVLLFAWRELGGWRRYTLAAAVWLATIAAAFGLSKAITDRPTHLWHSSLAVQDIVGTLHFTRSEVSDTSVRRALEGAPLAIRHGIQQWARTHYEPDSLLHVVIGPDRLFDLSLEHSAPPEQRAAIERGWRTIVGGRFVAYLRHRVEVMKATLGLTGESWNRKIIVTHDYQDHARLRELGISTGMSSYQSAVAALYEGASTTLLFRPYAYFAVALVMLALARRQRDVLAVLLSGLSIELSLFLLSPSADYRYSHWLVVTTLVAIVVLVARRYRDGDIARRSV